MHTARLFPSLELRKFPKAVVINGHAVIHTQHPLLVAAVEQPVAPESILPAGRCVGLFQRYSVRFPPVGTRLNPVQCLYPIGQRRIDNHITQFARPWKEYPFVQRDAFGPCRFIPFSCSRILQISLPVLNNPRARTRHRMHVQPGTIVCLFYFFDGSNCRRPHFERRTLGYFLGRSRDAPAQCEAKKYFPYHDRTNNIFTVHYLHWSTRHIGRKAITPYTHTQIYPFFYQQNYFTHSLSPLPD